MAPPSCPLCGGGPVRKAITAAAVHFKGSGWAKKERRSTSKPARSESDGGASDHGGTSGAATGSGTASSSTSESRGSEAAKTDTAKTDAAKTDHAKGAGTAASSSD